MGANDQFIGTLEAVIKKKLETIVDQNANSISKGRITELNFDLYEKIAREHGFTELADRISGVMTDGFASIMENLRNENTNKVKERNYPERNLEDYLCLPGKISLIEQGIGIVDRQYETRSGILDIFAKDSKGSEVVVELKMGKYDNQKVITQIQKYLNDKPDARLIFVAPYISPTVFWTFKDKLDSGRVKFYKVAKAGSEYSFKHENGEKIPMPRKIIPKGRKDKGEVVVYADFTTKKPRQVRARAAKAPAVAFAGGEAIAQGSFHEEFDKQPFYYRVLQMTRPQAGNLERYLGKMQVSAGQKKHLESLVMPDTMQSALRLYDEIESLHQKGILLREQNYVENLSINGFGKYCSNAEYNLLVNAVKRFNKSQISKLSTRTVLLLMNTSENAEGRTKLMVRALKESVSDLVRAAHNPKSEDADLELVRISEIVANKATAHKDAEVEKDARLFLSLLMGQQNYERIISELGATKVNRYAELSKIDQELAKSYLCFDIKVCSKMYPAEMRNTSPHQVMYEFIKKDNELYAQIVGRFEVQPVAKHDAKIQAAQAHLTPSAPINPLESALEESIARNLNGSATSEVRARIGYFVQDAAERLTPDQMQRYSAAFGKFHLANKFRKREELPADVKIRNFFDDITLQYLNRGIVPDEKALEAFYEKA